MKNVLCMKNVDSRYKMYNIGICDDGKSVCSSLEEMILGYGNKRCVDIDIKVWYSGISLCEYLKQGNHLDILFLDIELIETTGIAVANYIRDTLNDRSMQIVYISRVSSYAQKLFKTQPMDFLIKPITQENVEATLNVAMKILGKNQGKFEFQYGKEYYYIPLKDIMYFCSEGRKVKIVTSSGIHEFYGKLKDVNLRLPQHFIFIHQSYIVNKQYIEKYTYEQVEINNGEILAISKVNRKQVRKTILDGE